MAKEISDKVPVYCDECKRTFWISREYLEWCVQIGKLRTNMDCPYCGIPHAWIVEILLRKKIVGGD